LKADFIASLPYAAGGLRLLLILNETNVDGLREVGTDGKMVAHPRREKSARRAGPVRSKQIEKKVLGADLL
jgi:hypothetical protein